MRNYPTVDRESFQELLASAFAVQQMDSQSRSTLVEIGRSVTTGDLDVDEAVQLIVDPTQELESTGDVAAGLLNGVHLPPRVSRLLRQRISRQQPLIARMSACPRPK